MPKSGGGAGVQTFAQPLLPPEQRHHDQAGGGEVTTTRGLDVIWCLPPKSPIVSTPMSWAPDMASFFVWGPGLRTWCASSRPP